MMTATDKACDKGRVSVIAESQNKVKVAVPDGGWGWIVCISCLFGNFSTGGPVLCYGIILPALKEYYKDGVFIISLVGSVLSSLGFAVGPIAAILTNRFGLRLVYIFGSLLFSVSLVSATFVHDPYLLLLSYGVLAGIGCGLQLLPSTIGCNYYFEKKRAFANGIAKTGISLSVFIYPPMTDYILSHYDWKIAVYVYAGILLISCFFGALIRPLELSEIKNSKALPADDTNGRYNEASSKTKASEPMENVCFDKDFQGSEFQCTEGESNRKHSIVQIQVILENNKAMDTELVFQPKKRRGSKVYLPPLALNDTFCDKPVSDMKLNGTEKTDSIDTCPVEKFMSRRCSVIDLGKLDKDFESRENTKSFCQTLDRSLWCNTALWVLVLHRLLANFSQCIFFMFLPILIIDAGFSLNQASLMIMVTGITNTIARFISGLLMDRPEVNNFILTAGGFFIQAILLCIFPFCHEFIILMVLSGIVGVVVAPFQIGMAILAGEMLPVEKVATACGLMSFAQAIGNIIGPPAIGFIYDNHKDHVIIFFITAIGYLASGISCWISGCLYARKKTNIAI